MIEKNINSRIVHKHDIEENWIKAVNFTPKAGELIVYDIDANYSYERFKIGDGVLNVNELPFLSAQVDWDQTDENAIDYIKNKPMIATDEEIMDFMTEINLIIPVTSLDGDILTGNNGEIYSL